MDSKEPQVLEVAMLADGIQAILPDLHDYVFLTLFLGNDFMPHFPALNLRSNGMETLLKCYQQLQLPLNSSEKKNDISNPTVDEKLDILNKFRDNYFNPRNSNKSQQTN
jgi:5'-3' exoribonuclease 2